MGETSALELNAIYQGDCVSLLSDVEQETVDLAFADPPFNIGFKYDQYHDRHESDDYVAWCSDWMRELHRVLKPTGSFWLSIGDEYAAELKVAAQQLGFVSRNWVVWYYTFGQNCTRKFNRSHVHVFHFVKDEAQHTFNAQDPAVRVPSARALVYGDKRANPKGRLPDDTWILRPQDLKESPESWQPMDDTWFFSRVAGTFKERQGFHGCQMPEQLLGRIIRISSNPGDLVVDPFSGSGTTLAVAKKLGRRWLGMDLSDDYVKYANERLENAREGDPLNGPADPVASAPTTAGGRRLKDHPLLPTFKPEDFSKPEPILAESELPIADEPQTVEAAPEANVAEPSKEHVKDPIADSVSPPTEEPQPVAAPPSSPKPAAKISLRDLQRQVLVEAFLASHDGYSVDWLLCDPRLQDTFHEACREAGLIGRASDWNRELLKLRKAGKLKTSTAAKKIDVSAQMADDCGFAAEIAWAELDRKFPGWSLDALLCSPGKAFLFDRTAAKYLAGDLEKSEHTTVALCRWASLRLRKARQSLAEEAKQYHYVFADRDFAKPQAWSRFRAQKFDRQSGLYLLRNKSKDPLYIGETIDLGRRLAMHADAKAPGRLVTQVAVIPSSDLPSDDYRQPFWCDLVRRHRPRLNIAMVQPKSEQ